MTSRLGNGSVRIQGDRPRPPPPDFAGIEPPIETALLTIFSFSFNSPRGRAVMELRQAGEHCPLQ
jgi:hypothetical protein